jgi:outer membrane protein OmpA-like peptidoglycan-associated protein
MSEAGRSLVLMFIGLAVPVGTVMLWLGDAKQSLEAAPEAAAEVAIASTSEDEYCTPKLKQILRRVAGACGLLQEGGRGCKPTDAKQVAAMSGEDFNALFKPLSHRARIIQFDSEQTELDPGAQSAVEAAWSDQRGASFFFVVARASADGDMAFNQQLSQSRAESVLNHLEQRFQDPDLKQEVGLLWLGEEFAQLSEDFCSWGRSREGECTIKDINRSAFVAWIDCAI